jgi:NADH-quinone oxidoreductase subunit D
MELGAFTPFLWCIKVRDWLWDILEQETGARMTHSFGRIGGMAAPPTEKFEESVLAIIPQVEEVLRETESLLLKNRIFLDRTQGIGCLDKERAIAFGVTGPVLRSAGVDYDVRKAHPYMFYSQVDFDIPIGHDGDNYDRFMVRFEEVRQSIEIIRQCLERMPKDGPVDTDDPRFVLPDKMKVYNTIEATIAHFKLVMEGAKLPAGECYSFTEGGNGELGFYIVSDGSGTPYRVRCRPPCFYNLQICREMLIGDMVADIVPTFGSINMIGGECDR